MNNLTLTNNKHVNVKCPFGFANQLRLALAGCFLVCSGYINTFNIEWSINNHNNVNFLDFFEPLPFISFNKVSQTVPIEDIYETISFKRMIDIYTKNKHTCEEALQISLKYLIPKTDTNKLLQTFTNTHNINNALGVHVRRTCKTALLNNESHRTGNFLTNEEILRICKVYKTIFLATDNKETQQWFSERLGSQLLVFQSIVNGNEFYIGEYNTQNVLRYTTSTHTVLDFLLLKNCKTFLGSSESSFSLLIHKWRQNKEDFHIFGRL